MSMSKISIYQVSSERDANRVLFNNYRHTISAAGCVDASIYDKVWEGELDADSPDEVFMMFTVTVDRFNFGGHALSVSDVVAIERDDENPEYQFCDSIGWKDVTAEFTGHEPSSACKSS